ncbi:MAG: hypothetical protein PHU85_00700 [Phycisphaerae bacterium]|nr:hypothetical protein [Phycisphaerae bacterium]
MRLNVTIRCFLLIALAACLAGCLQVETRIELAQDGSATVTERIQFSKQLLDLADSAKADKATTQPTDLLSLLEKPAAVERIKRMGKGVTLTSHEVRAGAGASRESVAVYHVDDIREFLYCSPFLGFIDYPGNNVIKWEMIPLYESTWFGRQAGKMAVIVHLMKEGRTPPPLKQGEAPPPGPTPASVQMLRYLQPINRDMLSGFKVRVTFVSYAPLHFRMYFRYRNSAAGTHEFDLIDWSDKNLDQYSTNLLDNEEVMLELAGGRFASKNFLGATGEHGSNMTLPVYHPHGVPEIYFSPSRALFDKFFAGKILKIEARYGGDRPAKFEEIGYKASDEGKKPEQPGSASQPDAAGTTPTTRPAKP